MSQLVARDLTTKIARAARYDGPTIFIGCLNKSPASLSTWDGWYGLHLALRVAVMIRTDTRDGPESILRVGGSIFGKATKVVIMYEVAVMLRASGPEDD